MAEVTAIQKRNSIRANTCTGYLTNVTQANQDVIRGLILHDLLSSSKRTQDRGAELLTSSPMADSVVGDGEAWTGVLSEKDLLRFGLRARSRVMLTLTSESSINFKLDPSLQVKLQGDLDALILSMSDFLHANADRDHVGEVERRERAWSLVKEISSRQQEIASNESALNAVCHRIQNKVEKTMQTHLDLHGSLLDMISRYPAAINDKRSANNDLLAATIEVSLIKLSLLRARAHQALYGYKSADNPQSNMADALSAAYAKLKRDERQMEDEEGALDRQLEEYETMLRAIDGHGGGFAQVVEDWTRVEREKEECRRDLRRLGWTGD